jgi:hypothetical protein
MEAGYSRGMKWMAAGTGMFIPRLNITISVLKANAESNCRNFLDEVEKILAELNLP